MRFKCDECKQEFECNTDGLDAVECPICLSLNVTEIGND